MVSAAQYSPFVAQSLSSLHNATWHMHVHIRAAYILIRRYGATIPHSYPSEPLDSGLQLAVYRPRHRSGLALNIGPYT